MVGEEEASKSEREHRLEKNFQAANFPCRNTHTQVTFSSEVVHKQMTCAISSYKEKTQGPFETAGMQPAQQL